MVLRVKGDYEPKYESKGAAGFDIRTTVDTRLIPGRVNKVPTGLSVEVPEGYQLEIRPRSSLALKGITIPNAPGTVDSDYRGEIEILLYSLGGIHMIPAGERIAQGVLTPAPQAKIKMVENLTETERGTGGFGSTGKN